ncbi:MAG: hypothetical protein RLZZ387_260 [Chloroflexota bacterium]|jgi:hypothetical protein
MLLALIGGIVVGGFTSAIVSGLGFGRAPGIVIGLLVGFGLLLHFAAQAAGEGLSQSIFR